jgi:hypothetical protein
VGSWGCWEGDGGKAQSISRRGYAKSSSVATWWRQGSGPRDQIPVRPLRRSVTRHHCDQMSRNASTSSQAPMAEIPIPFLFVRDGPHGKRSSIVLNARTSVGWCFSLQQMSTPFYIYSGYLKLQGCEALEFPLCYVVALFCLTLQQICPLT